MGNNGLYNSEEERLLKKVSFLKEKMIDSLTDDGVNVPESSKEMRLLNEITNDVVDQIDKQVNARIKGAENLNSEEQTFLMAETLRAIKFGSLKGIKASDAADYDAKITKEIVPGELDIDSKKLTLDDIEEDEDDS